MKKTFRMIGAAMFAAMLTFGFTSCDDSDDAPINLPDDIKPTVIDEALAIVSDKLPGIDKAGIERFIESKGGMLDKILVYKSGTAIVIPAATKAINEEAIVCNYEIKDDFIVITAPAPIGEIKISTTVAVDAAVSIILNGGTEAATEIAIPAASTDNAKSLCRPWSKAKYKAGVLFDKVPVWGAQEKEKVDYNSIIDLQNAVAKKLTTDSDLKDNGISILSKNLIGASFASNNKVFFTFEDVRGKKSIEESTWKWIDEAKGTLETTLDGEKVKIDVRFQKGTPNKAIFVIDAKVKGIGGLGVHTLSGRLVCTMEG